MTTILFRNGKVVDGSGEEAFNGSVLVEGDKIKAVFTLRAIKSRPCSGKEKTSLTQTR